MEQVNKTGISNIIAHQCAKDSLRIEQWHDMVDYAIVFWMLHEVPDADRLIRELHTALSANGKLLFVEPFVHVSAQNFRQSLAMIEKSGFTLIDEPKIAISRAALLQKS